MARPAMRYYIPMNQRTFSTLSVFVTVFISGAVIMILEIVGTRILAPHVGSSLYVWTALIGVILASLSLGYWGGGKLADRHPSRTFFSCIFFAAALGIGMINPVKSFFFFAVLPFFSDFRLQAIVAAFLFTPSSVFLGMVSPYAIKLCLTSLDKSGTTAGRLSCVSTVGSIGGTFLAGFWLLATVGSARILTLLALAMFLCGILVLFPLEKKRFLILILIFIGLSILSVRRLPRPSNVVELDTAYNNVVIKTRRDGKSGRLIRELMTGKIGAQSAVFLDGDENELVFRYQGIFLAAANLARLDPAEQTGANERALLIGGGAFVFPRAFLRKYPDARMDAVEIDPALTDIARTYFFLRGEPRMSISNLDGRVFLQKSETSYDIVYVDAFGDALHIPFHLSTVEMAELISRHLTENGIAVVNVISAARGDGGKPLRALVRTYRQVFPHVLIFPMGGDAKQDLPQNIVVVALKSKTPVPQTALADALTEYAPVQLETPFDADAPVLTDDFSPVEYYVKDFHSH